MLPAGNLPPELGRLSTVTPDELERALRETLSRQAARSPHPTDAAATAIRRGRAGRRRRTLAGVVTAAVATALASVGAFSLGTPAGPPAVVVVGDPPTDTDWTGSDQAPSPADPTETGPSAEMASPAAPTGPPRADLVLGRELVTAGGERIGLPEDGAITAAHRATGGWLVTTRHSAGRFSLWYVTRTGPARRILTDLDRLVFAPDSQRVAWQIGGSLYAGTLAGERFSSTVRVAVPAGAEPVSFAGVAVLLRHGRAGGFDLWWPATGEYAPATKAIPVTVYGALPGGNTLVAAVKVAGQRYPCLALLDAGHDLAPLATGCTVPVTTAVGSISPDGRWLLTNVDPARPLTDRPGPTALLVDLATLGGTVSAAPAGSALATEPAWIDAGTAVHLDGSGELVRVFAPSVIDGADAERFPVDPGSGSAPAGGSAPIGGVDEPLLVTGR